MNERDQIEAAEARIGETLNGKWHLDRLLGVGGMAAVYEATHRNGHRGAVKLLHPELTRSADAKARFLREGYVANAVGHPGAVSVVDDDVTETGQLFLVMELLEGATLDAIADEEPAQRVDAATVLRVADEVLDVLVAAHDKGIVHRDLKPENLFLTAGKGAVRVLDFGIARLRQGAGAPATATRTGDSMGTPAYMPPEQALGNWDEVDARSDLWAVGATMFTLLTGRLVHDGNTVQKVMLAAMTAKAPPLASILSEVSPELAAIVDKALARERDDRFDSARTMQVAVRTARAKLPTPGLDLGALAVARARVSAGAATLEKASVSRPLAARAGSSSAIETTVARPAPPSRTRAIAIGLGVAVVVAAGVTSGVVLAGKTEPRTSAASTHDAPSLPTAEPSAAPHVEPSTHVVPSPVRAAPSATASTSATASATPEQPTAWTTPPPQTSAPPLPKPSVAEAPAAPTSPTAVVTPAPRPSTFNGGRH